MTNLLQILTEKKKKLDDFQPLKKEILQNLEDWFRVELTYSSNAIEGNTLTRLETAEVLEKGVTAIIPGKALKDQLEAVNHDAALKLVKVLAGKRKSHQEITEEDIRDIHKIILTRIDDAWAGKYRKSEVFIRGSNVDLPLPQKVPELMEKLILWLNSTQNLHPVRLAAEVHYKFESIHPFIDGNGRTGRLLLNLILILNGYPMIVIRNEERTQYLSSLGLAQTKADFEPFYHLIEISTQRSLDAYLAAASGKPALHAFKGKPIFIKKETTNLLKIGELAKETDEAISTLRYWTKMGLLKVTDYTEGGYQLYEPSMIKRIREIRKLQKEKRLTIKEITAYIQTARLTKMYGNDNLLS